MLVICLTTWENWYNPQYMKTGHMLLDLGFIENVLASINFENETANKSHPFREKRTIISGYVEPPNERFWLRKQKVKFDHARFIPHDAEAW